MRTGILHGLRWRIDRSALFLVSSCKRLVGLQRWWQIRRVTLIQFDDDAAQDVLHGDAEVQSGLHFRFQLFGGSRVHDIFLELLLFLLVEGLVLVDLVLRLRLLRDRQLPCALLFDALHGGCGSQKDICGIASEHMPRDPQRLVLPIAMGQKLLLLGEVFRGRPSHIWDSQ